MDRPHLPLTREIVAQREREIVAAEDELFRAARDRSSGEEREFWGRLLEERARNAAARRCR